MKIKKIKIGNDYFYPATITAAIKDPSIVKTDGTVMTQAEINQSILTAVDSKVDKVDGKALSTNDFTAAYKSKLDGIEAGANKYTLPTATSSVLGGVKSTTPEIIKMGYDYPVTVNSDGTMNVNVPWENTTYSVATQSVNGLMSSTDKTKLDGIAAGAQVNTVLGVKGGAESTYRTGNINITTTNIGAIPVSAIGAASGVAPLNASSLIDAKYLPSYVDDVLEFAGKDKFPTTGESGKIYVDTTAEENNTYRWSGTTYILIAKNTNTTYTLTKSGSKITLTGSDGSTTFVTDDNTTYSVATQSTNGLMSSTDKTKLDGIAAGANNYVLPTATSSVLGGVKVGSNITLSSGTISLTSTNVTSALGFTPVAADACSDTKDYDDLF